MLTDVKIIESSDKASNKGGPADRWQRRFFCEGHFIIKGQSFFRVHRIPANGI